MDQISVEYHKIDIFFFVDRIDQIAVGGFKIRIGLAKMPVWSCNKFEAGGFWEFHFPIGDKWHGQERRAEEADFLEKRAALHSEDLGLVVEKSGISCMIQTDLVQSC